MACAFGIQSNDMLSSSQGGRRELVCSLPRNVVPAAWFPFSGRVAQLAEHSALNRQVEGSIPSASTIRNQQLRAIGSQPKTGKKGRLYPFLYLPQFKMLRIR